jgi:hypothetical protein
MFMDIIHVLSLSKTPSCVYLKTHNVSETGFCLRLQVKPTQLGPIDRASPCLSLRKAVFLNKNRTVLDKNRTIDNVQKHGKGKR